MTCIGHKNIEIDLIQDILRYDQTGTPQLLGFYRNENGNELARMNSKARK